MTTTSVRASAGLIHHYLAGNLPLPGFVVQALLHIGTEMFYRLSPTFEELPPEWSGDEGPIAEQSSELMEIHYDQPLALFENFLGPTMKYTMALWERGARDLEDAQTQMMDDVCDKVGIQDGENVLDIACGFGSLSAHILKRFPGCKVTALNLSNTQCDYIESQQNNPDSPLHTDRFRLMRGDFAQAQLDRQFDRITVVGLFEHIRNLNAALQKIADFLKPNGKVFLHYITYNRIIRVMADPYSDMFMNRYIFPGGRFWYFGELERHQEHLKIERSWFMNGQNYKRTLQAWHRNFWKNIDRIRAIPSVDERFVRIWDLYLRMCVSAFGGMGGRNVGNGQYVLSHAQPVT